VKESKDDIGQQKFILKNFQSATKKAIYTDIPTSLKELKEANAKTEKDFKRYEKYCQQELQKINTKAKALTEETKNHFREVE